MKQACLITRQDNPEIAQLYGIDFDRNLMNNFRVFCTKYSDNFRFFLPEETFLDIRNGVVPPVTAELWYKGKSYPLDLLQTLSEQMEDMRLGSRLDYSGMQIRIHMDGYELPAPETALVPLSKTVTAEEITSLVVAEKKKPDETEYMQEPEEEEDEIIEEETESYEKPKKKGFFGKAVTVLLVAVIFVAAGAGAAVFMNGRNDSVKKVKEALANADYSTAVVIYNDEIYGDSDKEEQANVIVEEEIDGITSDYLDGDSSYEDACDHLNTLADIENQEITDAVNKALETVNNSVSADEAYEKGLALLEDGKYIEAVKAFLEVAEGSETYDKAQKKLDECVEAFVKSFDSVKSAEECQEALKNVDKMLELLPDHSGLKKCRESLQEKYSGYIKDEALVAVEQYIQNKDYKSAIETLEKALKEITDEELETKLAEVQKEYVTYVTEQVNEKLEKADYDNALTLLETAKKVYSCSEFDTLYDQVLEKQEKKTESLQSVTIGDVEFLSWSGSIGGKDEYYQYSVKAPETGKYRFYLSDMLSGFSVGVNVYSADGSRVEGDGYMQNGEGLTCDLTKGQTYTVEVSSCGDHTGSYTLIGGQQKPNTDITSYDEVYDSIEYKDQKNTYTFVPDYEGVYRFDLSNVVNGFKLKMYVYDSLGYEVSGNYSLSNGSGVTANLKADEKYSVVVYQQDGTGDYTLTMGKQRPTIEITGKKAVSGTIVYTDQNDVFSFTSGQAGKYIFTLADMENDFRVGFRIYDKLGYEVGGSSYGKENESTVEVDLSAGEYYEVRVNQNNGFGYYSFSVSTE